MASETWDSIAVPILKAIAEAELEGSRANFDAVVSRVGVDRSKVERELRALMADGYVDGIDASSSAGFNAIELRLLPRGKQIVGEWPSADDLVRVVIEKVDVLIREQSDPGVRSGLEKLKDGILSIPSSVAAALLADLLRSLG